MHRPAVTPALLLALVVAFVAATVATTLWVAGNTPWLGAPLIVTERGVELERSAFGLRGGTAVQAIGLPAQPLMAIEPRDLLAEPDGLTRYADIKAFLVRQDQLFALLQSPLLELRFINPGDGPDRVLLVPEMRPVGSLPPSFWVQIITGVAGLLISGWVWALRPRQLPAILFAISGLGVLLTTFTSALYAHRGLAMPADAYAVLLPINHAGTLCFGAGLIGLFLLYPRRLVHPAWLWLLPAILLPYYFTDVFQTVFEADTYYNLILGLVVAALGLIAVQWWSTRHSPDERAVLGWLGLSVTLGVGIFAFLAIAPDLLGLHNAMAQHYAAGSLIIIYAGLAFGLRRYRLFELGEWAYRILFYTVGAFLLLLLDAALIATLNLELAPALALSLLLIGLIYLPLRDLLWTRLFARNRIEQHELFSAAMEVAFAPSRADSATRWNALVTRLFDPLEITEHPDPPAHTIVHEDGLQLDLPRVAGAAGLRLRYPFGGSGLFQPGHLALANELVALTGRAEEGRQAYMRGVGEERRRMARDLHDDVGARLLTGLHTADEATRPTLQAALSDIRAIVSGLSGEEASLDRVLAETRHEAARRLEAAGITLDCPLPGPEAEGIALDYRIHKALTSAVREIVSNTIRHSGASRLTVSPSLSSGHLRLVFADDGTGLPMAAQTGQTGGYGLRNMRHRIEDIGGRLTLDTAPTGTAITLDIPLLLAPLTPEPGVSDPVDALNSPA
jgi:two-component system sensor histidine kinase DevS